jgi:hypothetical protein
MLDTIVRYLHESLVPFRLSSYPSLEHIPEAAQPIPHFAVLVRTRLVMIGGKLSILCFAATDQADLSALANELGAPVVDARESDLSDALKRFEAPPPPLGQLFGLSVVLDSDVAGHECIVMQPFGESDYLEIPYDDFARQEQPKVVSFARAGELPAASQEAPSVGARS